MRVQITTTPYPIVPCRVRPIVHFTDEQKINQWWHPIAFQIETNFCDRKGIKDVPILHKVIG